MPEERFDDISVPPERTTAGTILQRLIDGLGFRYRWATDGLREADFAFRPADDCMSTEELLQHILMLVTRADAVLGGGDQGSDPAKGMNSLKQATLQALARLSERVAEMDGAALDACKIKRKDTEMPFWYTINGPLADALTHVGQLNAWRRLNGNPTPGANLFVGKPPGA